MCLPRFMPLLVALAAIGCASCQRAPRVREAESDSLRVGIPAAEASRTAIYEAVLDAHAGSGVQEVYLRRATRPGFALSLGIHPPGVSPDTESDFSSRSAGALPMDLLPRRGLAILDAEPFDFRENAASDAAVETARTGSDSTPAPANPPAKYLRLSEPGISRDGRQAVVVLVSTVGAHWEETTVVLRRDGSRWSVAENYLFAMQ